MEKIGTPIQLYTTVHMSGKVATAIISNENVEMLTPNGSSRCQKKMLNPRTPSKPPNCSMSTTYSSISSTSSKQMSYSTSSNTPPPKRFQRIKNPFEPVLAERLHLPLIASPSLFQRPTTPQLSSTQFEWNIDEVSSLQPANVEPHETQFHDSPDPDYEAKAQSAISSYFKEQQIVPSPVDCPLRSQRIILSELNSNTPITKPGRRIRDCGTQTELTLPVVLPGALEEALMPYFQPHLSVADRYVCDMDTQMRMSSDTGSISFYETKDMSLRRKLFDINNIVVVGEDGGRTPTTAAAKSKLSHSNSSPTSTCGSAPFAIVGKLSDSLDKSSFGSLSPISAYDCLSNSPHSPQSNRSALKSSIHTFVENLADAELLSPIHPPVRQTTTRTKRSLDKAPHTTNMLQPTTSKESYRCSALNQSEATTLSDDLSLLCANVGGNVSDSFTPDRSSSPLHSLACATDASVGQHSIDSSFNMKVSRLVVNSAKCVRQFQQQVVRPQDYDMFAHDDTQELLCDDDDMQVSQLSAHNFNCSSSSSSDTPRSKRRSASRKNLSQSFSLNWLDDEDIIESADKQQEKQIPAKIPLDVPRINLNIVEDLIVKEQELQKQQQLKEQQETHDLLQNQATTLVNASNDDSKQAHDATTATRAALFYRTDSGFNDMPNSGCSSSYSIGLSSQQSEPTLSPTKQLDVSMVCCSTPSSKLNAATVTKAAS